jgi:hypothetical protein
MSDTFQSGALKVLLAQDWIVPAERRLLEVLLGAAVMGVYWDELNRIRTREPDVDLILQNITVKGRAFGLGPVLQQLRDQINAQDAELRRDVPHNGPDAQPQPAV